MLEKEVRANRKRLEREANDSAKVTSCSPHSYIVDTPNFVSSYRLQPVVNDSDLLSGRDFAPLTHRRHRVS